MKTTINFYEFRNWFNQNRPDNFSSDGLVALFEYFTQCEADCGEEYEFDPVAICCEYAEYESMEAFHFDYDAETYPDQDAISNATQLILFKNIGNTVDGGFIILAF